MRIQTYDKINTNARARESAFLARLSKNLTSRALTRVTLVVARKNRVTPLNTAFKIYIYMYILRRYLARRFAHGGSKVTLKRDLSTFLSLSLSALLFLLSPSLSLYFPASLFLLSVSLSLSFALYPESLVEFRRIVLVVELTAPRQLRN